MDIEILKAGPLSSIQDIGRRGYLKYGISPSGVMDRKAYFEANELVGNKAGEAVIEATLMGPEIRFNKESIFAITGAEMNAELDGVPIERGRPSKALPGQVLTSGIAIKGVRSYIAFRGGIDLPFVMGSRSTNLKSSIGGYEGRKLENGDSMNLSENIMASKNDEEKILEKFISQPDYKSEITVRAVPGPQYDLFSEEAAKNFFSKAYMVSNDSDRMGIRLEGESLKGINGTDIISDGTAFGSVQISSSGQPIVLMADRQTTGGYAKIATVITEDLSLLAQARPGDRVYFQKIDISDLQRKAGILRWIFQKKNRCR